ncbi:MAG: hypothetical protein ACREQ5_29105, partial [Candidatus Dormibacteria bacterium]
MANKKQTLELAIDGLGCLGKAADHEPVFVLRAKDRFAPYLIRCWAAEVQAAAGPSEKADHPLQLADQMEQWQRKFGSK